MESKYLTSQVSGGKDLLFNFLAPPEYFQDVYMNDTERQEMLIKYFSLLYPLTRKSFWSSMSSLIDYYYTLDFWYCFNDSWTVSPFPVTLDKRVINKWEKNTFYQAGTIIQSNITSWCWGLDENGERVYLPARLNNAPQEDALYTYEDMNKNYKTIRSVTTEKNFWDDLLNGNKPDIKLEITSWGWNPYPFGIYSQGPFRGSGVFLDIPKKRTLVGTCHWDIIYKCKNDTVSDAEIISLIMNHELNSFAATTQALYCNSKYCSPIYLIRNETTMTYTWETLNNLYWPLVVCYYCFIIGGFQNDKNNFSSTAKAPYDDFWTNVGYTKGIVLQRRSDNTIFFPSDQSVTSPTLNRTSDDFWNFFMDTFFSKLQAWDTNWITNIWRYPIFDMPAGTGPCVANPSDDLMMAMMTGNIDIVNYSIWKTPKSQTISNTVSKYYRNPLKWSHIQKENGVLIKKVGTNEGFPVGYLVNESNTSDTPIFCIRTQMPNVNGDICTEFADFRCTTPGNLADGSGDQQFWSKVFSYYCKKYVFTVDMENPENFQSFSGHFKPWLPKTTLKIVNLDENAWKTQENTSLSKTFYDFDPYYGEWCGDNAYIYQTNNKTFQQLPFFLGPNTAGAVGADKNMYTVNGNITAVSCKTESYKMKNIKNSDYVVNSMGGQPFNGGAICGTSQCTGGNGWICYTFAKDKTSYFPNPVDTFTKGTVGYMKVNGACNTRWSLSSKGIPWRFDAPLANLQILKNKYVFIDTNNKNSFPWLVVTFTVLIIGIILYYFLPQFKVLIGISCSIILLITLVYFLLNKNKDRDRKKLLIYLSNVYPSISKGILSQFTTDQLRIFYCSLHMWFKGEGLPSPKDYIHDVKYWDNIPPFDENSSWKTFTVRKNTVIGYPQVKDVNTNQIAVGWDENIGTDENDTPSGILYRGRQLQDPDTTNIQKTTFFEPVQNLFTDTYNCFTGVNDPSLSSWEQCERVEVLSTWCAFPDGAYVDYSPGSGCFYELGKHKVAYTGAHLVLCLGNEFMDNLDLSKLTNIYWQGWQRAGYGGTSNDPTQDVMKINNQGNISLNSKLLNDINGLYSTLVMTSSQLNQIKTATDESGNLPNKNLNLQVHPADSSWWKTIASLMDFKYYLPTTNAWVKEIPNTVEYVPYYPFPLPFFSGRLSESSSAEINGLPKINENALKMPWKYQFFNISDLFRSLVLSAVFLNENSISNDEIVKKGCDYNYVDLLKANLKNPLPSARSWEDAIDVICTLLGKPLPHPFFSIWPRIESYIDQNKNITTLQTGPMDGPELILTNFINNIETELTFERVYSGALDKSKYVQDMISNGGGYNVKQLNNLPQFQYANLDIDHWQSALGIALQYDSLCRIQHWCGSKNMAYDTEIISLRMSVLGNLLENKLYTNIFEKWKQNSNLFSTCNPFDPKNNPYASKYKSLINLKQSDLYETGLQTSWIKPPWINFDKNNNIYGWPLEDLNNFNVTNRLSYSPVGTLSIPFSVSFPEYNKYTFQYLLNIT